MRIEFDVFGDRQVARDLLRIGDRAVDATPAFAQMLLDLVDLEREQFGSEGQRASGGWAPLAASTLARKRANGLDERILRATGALYESLEETSSGGDAIRHADPTQMVFGTTVPYARYHQLGQGVPRRRPVELAERDRQGLVKTLQRYVMTGDL